MSEINGHVQIRDDQRTQNVKYGCTPLIFSIIYSFDASQQMIMSPQLINNSRYITMGKSKRSIKLNFLACIECPIGFQQIMDTEKDVIVSICHAMLHVGSCKYNYSRETVTKKGTTAWITYLNGLEYLLL